MATHSSILALDRGTWRATVHGVAKSWTRQTTKKKSTPPQKKTPVNPVILSFSSLPCSLRSNFPARYRHPKKCRLYSCVYNVGIFILICISFSFHNRRCAPSTHVLDPMNSYLLPCLLCAMCSIVSDSLWLHGLQPTRLLCPWNFPGKNTGVGCHFLL